MNNPTHDHFMQELMASANFDIRAILDAIAANPGVSIQEFCNIAKGIDEVANVSSTENEAYIEFGGFCNHHKFTVYKDADGKLVLNTEFRFAFDEENTEARIFEYGYGLDYAKAPLNSEMRISKANLPILGAICGDIIGSGFEHDGEKDYDFDLFYQDATFTDDTVCTMAVADALEGRKPIDATLQQWGRKYPYAGYGGTFRRWIRSEDPKPYNSWGNGAAMRVSAVPRFADNIEDVVRLATDSAIVTHNHPEGIKGAVATACAIYLAQQGKSKDEIKSYIQDTCGYDLERKYADIQPDYMFDVSCQGSVPESLICFLESDSYEDTIRKAIAMGGDTDTMAAIAGGIAAAFYGEIPEEILSHCIKRLPSDMTELLNRLA